MYTLMQRDPKFLGTYCIVIKLVILWIQHYSRILWFPQRLGEGVNMCTFYLHLAKHFPRANCEFPVTEAANSWLL